MTGRLHPLSVPYRALSGSINLGTVVYLGTLVGSGVDPRSLRFAGALGGYVLLMVVYQTVYYRRFRYDDDGDRLEVVSGVLSRQRREIPLDRVQNVDVSQNPVQRALGIAAVRVETAGGGDTEASLRYVGRREADRIREQLGGRRSGARPDADRAGAVGSDRVEPGRVASEGTAAGHGAAGAAGDRTADREVVYELPTRNLLVLSLFTVDAGAGVVSSAVGALVTAGNPRTIAGIGRVVDRVPGGPVAAAAAGLAALVALTWLLSVALTFARYYDFRLSRVGDDLAYERGLLQRHSGTLPLEKVQRLSIHENLAHRRLGYATLAVETAGYGPGDDAGQQSVVPLARRSRAVEVARSVEPFDPDDLQLRRPPARARRRYLGRFALGWLALVGVVAGAVRVAPATADVPVAVWAGALAATVLAAPAAHLRWRNRGHGDGDDHFLARTGFWRRTTRIVPHYRIQTVVETQTPFQRRRNLASLTADTASSAGLGGGHATAIDVDRSVAADLYDRLPDRLQESLRDRRRSRRRTERAQAGPEADRAADPPGTDRSPAAVADSGSDGSPDATTAGDPPGSDRGDASDAGGGTDGEGTDGAGDGDPGGDSDRDAGRPDPSPDWEPVPDPDDATGDRASGGDGSDGEDSGRDGSGDEGSDDDATGDGAPDDRAGGGDGSDDPDRG